MRGSASDFAPKGDEVLMYVCGITPYSESHVGHAMSYIIFDVLRRYLEYRGMRVKHVQNFTDIDDKIINRANERGIPFEDLAGQYIEGYHENMRRLNVLPAHVYPRATQEIPKIIEIIEGLIAKGFAYASGGDVYYRVAKKTDYGKLSHRNTEELLAGARIDPTEVKEDPLDFALWKGAKPGEPSWQSPWGPGRPGWHIECSAMSLRYLGPELDIHGGGQDLVFPHHENEIAQTEAFTGVIPFARFWVHNGLMRFGEEKMSKSLGNLVTIDDALERYTANGLRLFVLGSHYRSPLTWSEESLDGARKGAERLLQALRAADGGAGEPVDAAPFHERFIEAMEDDLNTSRAVAALFDLAREINRGRDAGRPVAEAQEVLREIAGVFGLAFEAAEGGSAGPYIDLLLDVRQQLRAAKQFQQADYIRQQLAALGITIEDGPGGSTWHA